MASRLKDDSIVNKNNDNEDLLVFGYSCKLFRDDEKALYIDQGKHLIPWMGDEALKIDRYDARGTLLDLKQVEAPSGGFDKYFGLTDMERQVESMCDEERYRALVTNEEEETMYQEEELKRLHYAIRDKGNSYGQVEYKYDGEANIMEESQGKPLVEKAEDGGDEPFVPSPQLDLPLDMALPETVKHNAIIEKTALFISNQGPQMEILLKMKQAGNPQFNFLSFDNPLHSYYRHLLMAIKAGRYNPEIENSNKKEEVENSEDHYLHPSLASSVSKVELAPSIPSINYKPSAHCAYSMLVNKIKDKTSHEQGGESTKLREEALDRLKGDKREGGSESEGESARHHSIEKATNLVTFATPLKDMQIIIDKMASYVVKNGRDFETVVRMKNDPRFDFLNSSHIYNPYYQYKVKQYESVEKCAKQETKKKLENSNLRIREEQSKGKLAPVCFSIKKPKDSEPVIEKSALPVEESSDEEGKAEKEREVAEDKEREKEKEKEKDREMEREREKEKEMEKEKERDREKEGEVITIDLAAIEEKEEKTKKILAAERLKDKLTAAAREKVAMQARERQLQLERKRRAAAFLKIIHSDGKSGIVHGPQLLEGIDREAESGSDVPSLPETFDDCGEKEFGEKSKSTGSRHESSRHVEEKREKSHRKSTSVVRHKHREKRGAKERFFSEKTENNLLDGERGKEINGRVMESSSSSEDDEKRRGTGRTEENSWKTKFEGGRSFRNVEKRHKKKKHKKDGALDRSSRKHSKLKRDRKSRRHEESRTVKSKRIRRDSSSSSDSQNS